MDINIYINGNRAVIALPEGECMEVRPDWGVYHPVVTFPAIERAIRTRGLDPIGQWSFSIAKDAKAQS